jgi:predicted nucleic acid-binding protein
MDKRGEAYVDTSALIAFVDRSDTHHRLFLRLFAAPPPLVTTALVVAEGHGWFLKRYDRTRALQFLALIEDMKPLAVLPVGPGDMKGGSELLRRFADQDLSLTDAIGLFVMKQRRSGACWSADRHLGLTGVPLAIDQS